MNLPEVRRKARRPWRRHCQCHRGHRRLARLGNLCGRQPLPFGQTLPVLNAVPTHGPCRFPPTAVLSGFRELEHFCGFRRNGFSHSRENDLVDRPARDFVARLPPWVFCLQKQLFAQRPSFRFFVDLLTADRRATFSPRNGGSPHRRNFCRSSPSSISPAQGTFSDRRDLGFAGRLS